MWTEITDPNAVPICGTANAQNVTLGTTFTFDPFPDGYACDGYRIYAGVTSGELYYQGELYGRFNTTFTVGSAPLTSPVNATGDILDAQTMGPPAFATALEVFESEGSVDSRIFLGGGKPIRYRRRVSRNQPSSIASENLLLAMVTGCIP
jgi:hypothetical protein